MLLVRRPSHSPSFFAVRLKYSSRYDVSICLLFLPRLLPCEASQNRLYRERSKGNWNHRDDVKRIKRAT